MAAAAQVQRERHGADTVWRYPAADDALVSAALNWLEAGVCDRGQRQGQAPVWLTEDGLAVKFQAAPDKPGRAWRRSRLRRAAEAHAALSGVASPEPLVVAERRIAGRLQRAVLVMAQVAGVTMEDAWKDQAARDALGPALAALLAAGPLHGDLHPLNMLWDGKRWAVIDLDSMRHGLHRLVRRRAWIRVIGGLHFKLAAAPGLREVHAAACAAAGYHDVEQRWQAALRYSARMARARGQEPFPEQRKPG